MNSADLEAAQTVYSLDRLAAGIKLNSVCVRVYV